jgi:hypothetical protein
MSPNTCPPPPVRSNMASVAVIANPLSKNQDKVLVFQSGDTTYGLCVSPRSLLVDEVKASIGPTSPDSVGRRLAQPSQLVSMVLQDTVRVYGVTGDVQADLQVELLSPVENPLKRKPETGALAGCSRPDGERGWLYMITKEDGEDKIAEWELSSGGPSLKCLDCDGFSKDTSLYAVYDDKLQTRWLIYQTSDNGLVIHDAKRNEGFTVKKSSTRAMAKTPLAAAIVPASLEGEAKRRQRIVLYFIGIEGQKKKHLLYSANAALGETISFNKPDEEPTVLEGPDGKVDLLEWAGLAAHLDKPRQRVVVFGLTTKIDGQEGVFAGIPHDWSTLPA